jgi:hypothetical protein
LAQPPPSLSLFYLLFGQVIQTGLISPHVLECTHPATHPATPGQSIALSPLLVFGLGIDPDRPFALLVVLHRNPYRTDRLALLLCSCMLRNTAARVLPPNTLLPLCPPSRTVQSSTVHAGPLVPGGVQELQTYKLRPLSLASADPTSTSRAYSRASIFPCREAGAFLDLYLGSRLPCPFPLRHQRQSHPTPSYPQAAAAQTQKRHSSQP